MRWVLGVVIAIAVAAGAYVWSAVASLDGLVEAARAADGAALLARTNVSRLRHSLADQIVAAYLRRTGQDRPIRPLEQMLANTYGSAIADALVGKLLTEENLTNMLSKGAIADAGNANMPRLGQLDTSKIAEIWSRISLVKPVEFAVRLGGNEGSGAISLHFEGDGWKLSGVQLPEAAVQALAQTLPENIGRKR
jgi:hypothetical protein